MAGRRRTFGLTLSCLRADEVIEQVMGAPTGMGVRLVVTPNIDHIRLLRDADFAASYESADLVCPDGFPVLLYARLRGLALSGRVTGCELFRWLASHADLSAKKLLIVVEAQATACAVRAWAEGLGLQHVSVLTAPSGLAHDLAAQGALADAIRSVAPDILVMTLGAPVSEVFVHRHRLALPSCWALCVGQAVRIHLGLVRRAPARWQRLGLEWLWRIQQEPRRLAGRYVRALAWFPVAVFRDVLGWPVIGV